MLGELYHTRWEVEEFFKTLKGPYIGQGQFRSKSPSGVRQEILALMLLLAITALCSNAAAATEGVDEHSIARKPAILAVDAYVTRLFLTEGVVPAMDVLQDLLSRISRSRYKRRYGRKAPRRSLKPARRWGPAGRTGA